MIILVCLHQMLEVFGFFFFESPVSRIGSHDLLHFFVLSQNEQLLAIEIEFLICYIMLLHDYLLLFLNVLLLYLGSPLRRELFYRNMLVMIHVLLILIHL